MCKVLCVYLFVISLVDAVMTLKRLFKMLLHQFFVTDLDLGATGVVSERISFVAQQMALRLERWEQDALAWVDCPRLLSNTVTFFLSLAHAPGPLLTSFRFLKYIIIYFYSC